MKSDKLLNAIGGIDDNLVSDAVRDVNGKKAKNWIKWGKLAAVMALCVGLGALGATLLHTGGPNPAGQEHFASADSVVILDVNPSISLTVDPEEKIVRAEGLNADGAAILDGMDLTGTDLTVAVNAVIGSMLQKGYLNNLQNAILVSVENEDAEKSAALKERISALIGNALQDGNLDGSVLSQTLSGNSAWEQLAQEHHISPGKAALIQEVLAQDPTLTAENLAPLSITEIALISQSKHLAPTALTQNGTASDKAYISREDAMAFAYAHAGVNAGDVTWLEVEFDSDGGIMVYEVEFAAGSVEYECKVDARTGQIVKYEMEYKNIPAQGGNTLQPSAAQTQAPDTAAQAPQQDPAASQQPQQNPAASQQPQQNPAASQQPSANYIGEEAAGKAALANAGITADEVSYLNAWLEYDDGRPEHYEVEFVAGNLKYEYEIDLYSGTILAQEMESLGNSDPNHGGNHPSGPAPAPGISTEDAIAAALSHAGLSESQIRKLETDYDYDDGVAVYEVEFEYGAYEYEYKIDAATGTILKYEIDD